MITHGYDHNLRINTIVCTMLARQLASHSFDDMEVVDTAGKKRRRS